VTQHRTSLRTGSGIDIHAFGPGDSVMLAGLRVPHSHGIVAHSDGDVLLHALVDALLGAAGLGDIGMHFPDTDPRWRGADSAHFVLHACELLTGRGYRVVNADLTLLAQAPKIAALRDAMRSNVARLLGIPADCVNVKATTPEHLGSLGRREGLAAMASVLIEQRVPD
jgi:2-C-methyl-D-erythritol 2,4-cyclodiphosphate synthase